MTTSEAIAHLNATTPFYAVLMFGNVTIYNGCEHDAEVVTKLWADDWLMAAMVMSFVEIYEQNKTGAHAHKDEAPVSVNPTKLTKGL